MYSGYANHFSAQSRHPGSDVTPDAVSAVHNGSDFRASDRKMENDNIEDSQKKKKMEERRQISPHWRQNTISDSSEKTLRVTDTATCWVPIDI